MLLIFMISSPGSKTPRPLLFSLLVVCFLTFIVPNVRADLSPKQALKLITRMPGFELTNGSVRIKTISSTSSQAAGVTAEIRTECKFEKHKQGSWREEAIRTRPDQWEDLTLVAKALGSSWVGAECSAQ